MLLRLPSKGNRELNAISATSTGYRKLRFELKSRSDFNDFYLKNAADQPHIRPSSTVCILVKSDDQR